MKRYSNVIVICIAFLIPLFNSCQKGEPPFEVLSASERRNSMIGGFGEYVLSHPKADQVLVHQKSYLLDTNLQVDFYYPPGFRFNKPQPAVIVVGGNVNWSSNVTLGELLAANGLVTIIPETLQMVKDDAPDRLAELISLVLENSRGLFIDKDRIAVWTEGHPSSLALQIVMDRQLDFHGGIRAAVFASPVMTFAQNSFNYDPAWIDPNIPVFISRGEEDSFYEVKASVKQYMQTAEKAGGKVTYLEVAGGNHNWMTDRDTEASHQAIKAEIKFLKKHLQ